ncbi:hypothetical protein COOONC_00371 [Cooperia oncophora]
MVELLQLKNNSVVVALSNENVMKRFIRLIVSKVQANKKSQVNISAQLIEFDRTSGKTSSTAKALQFERAHRQRRHHAIHRSIRKKQNGGRGVKQISYLAYLKEHSCESHYTTEPCQWPPTDQPHHVYHKT